MGGDSLSIVKKKSYQNNEEFQSLYSQVGGHVNMKILNEKYVLKPLNKREANFYENLPAELSDIVPVYYGTAGNQQENQMLNRTEDDYIIMENLTLGYKKPCVLDLKMGTRMWGDFASEAKIESQKRKCQKSTSAKLGVRFCGSQRYSVSKNNFEKLDKYVGRRATEREFRELLANFFFNSGFLRTDIIQKVIDEIRKMRQKLRGLDGYRFYSSSLLIIYEGKQIVGQAGDSNYEDSLDCETLSFFKSAINSPIKVKIIDFANSAVPHNDEENATCNCNIYHPGPDGGFLMGLENLQEILEALVEDEKQNIRKL